MFPSREPTSRTTRHTGKASLGALVPDNAATENHSPGRKALLLQLPQQKGEGMLFTRRLGGLLPLLFVLGLVSLSFLLGAAVMFFGLPPAKYLYKAFVGARAWNEGRQIIARTVLPPANEARPSRVVPRTDRPDKTCDGFTLYVVAPGTCARLIDMRGEVVHEWDMPFHKAWPEPSHVRVPVNDDLISPIDCRPFSNGDLLMTFHGLTGANYGYGLVKMDRSSNVLWRYSANAHHDIDIGDDGTIYTLKQDVVHEAPRGLELLPVPYASESLALLSPDGVEKKCIPILDALRDSSHFPLLSSLERATEPRGFAGLADEKAHDPLHANHVAVLSQRLAPKFPLFKQGQVLVCLRNLDALAVLDAGNGTVTWAARGPWKMQHDAQFLDNGHLLVFDNLGSQRGSRVLEYDPQTGAVPWFYQEGFVSSIRGMAQRLPNGNTLVVDSQGATIREVSPEREVVWCCKVEGHVQAARRYSAQDLSFLSPRRARP